MTQLGLTGISDSQKAEMWQQWKRGQSLSDIGRALGKHAVSIHGVLIANGGIAPSLRRRARLALPLAELEEISRGIAQGLSIRHMAAPMERPPSTVSHEIARHSGRKQSRAAVAEKEAWAQACRPKPCRLAIYPILQRIVAEKLRLEWSPEQIAGWLRHTFPEDKQMQVSQETIYRSLFIQARGVLKKELTRHLRSRRRMRRAQCATKKGQPRGRITDGVSIRERSADVNSRAIPGHWESDLMTGRTTLTSPLLGNGSPVLRCW